jgi:hypothetical protein
MGMICNDGAGLWEWCNDDDESDGLRRVYGFRKRGLRYGTDVDESDGLRRVYGFRKRGLR